MKKYRLPARLLAGLLLFVLLFSLSPAAFAVEGSVTIGSLNELRKFAERCASDSYSEGLSVVLTADIDAEGEAVSIPVFLGSFDGQGHKITGLSLTESNSTYGLFSRIESGAVVKNLTVEGEVSPSGTQNAVGGLAGENHGTIENCSFSGVVMGSSSVGGLVGSNCGKITGCTFSGVVRGTQYTGGIAGQNSGSILRCENAAAVNTTVSDEDLVSAGIAGVESTFYSILKKEDVTEDAITTDTGGIAGLSTGVIQSCTNKGAVGYPHVGYNVGGIAGRQSGYLASCVNRGEIQGRKDVGGIVGQMVPDITLQVSGNVLDDLQGELNTLQSLINLALNDAQSASDTVSGRFSHISTYAESAMESTSSLSDQLGEFVDSNVETVDNLLLLVERYLARLAPILDELSAASGSVAESIAEMSELAAMLDDTLVLSDIALSQLQSFCTEMEAACDDMLTGLDALEYAMSLVEGFPAMPDTAQLRESIAALREAAAALKATIACALEEVAGSGSVAPETMAQLKNGLLTVLDCYRAANCALIDVLISTDFDALRDQNEETLRQILASLQTAMDSFSSATSHLSAAMGWLYDALGTLRAINSQAEEILAQLDTALSAVQCAADAVYYAVSETAEWVRDLSNEDVGSFSTLGSDFSESSDALNTSLSGISNELSALTGEMSSSNTVLLSDVRAINNQFMNVMNLFLNALNDTQNVDYSDVFEDVSEESLQNATRGKVMECTNRGSVTADRNAGGIAGAMAIEYDTDPEDDLFSSENRSTGFTYQTKAILLDCDNYGSVQAKKSCAGGITGRMDLGTISGCGGWGSTDSESGDYVGGVAGLSLSSIRGSYAKCSLSGGKYVGGIVGSGSRVSDCVSMVQITGYTQLGGAIAGEITGEYSNNLFVSDTLAGVDRVSYSGKAEQISYDELCAIGDIPENFLHMTLRFVAEDTVLREQKFDYGASFTEDVYPEIPAKEDCYGEWDITDLTNLHFDTVVKVNYEPYITTLASDTRRDGHAEVLVEGRFRNGDSLCVEKSAAAVSGQDEQTDVWTLTIPDDGQPSHTVRWLIPSDGTYAYTVYVMRAGSWCKVTSEQIGGYLCFVLDGNGQFFVAPTEQIVWWVWVLAGIGCAGAAGVILLLIRRRKMRR